MRAFIAIDPPYEIKNFITVQLFNLKSKFDYQQIKWVETQNYHITFRFFQQIDEQEAISKFLNLEQLLITTPKENIKILPKLGFFFNNQKIKVIYLQLEPKKFFYNLDNTISIVFGKEKFYPHLTIGRVKKNLTNQQREYLEKFMIEEITFIAQNIVLFKSTLTPIGPIYNPIKEILLK